MGIISCFFFLGGGGNLTPPFSTGNFTGVRDSGRAFSSMNSWNPLRFHRVEEGLQDLLEKVLTEASRPGGGWLGPPCFLMAG